MIHGVWINDKNTLAEWGLALLAELSIGSPEPKLSYVKVPEADGDMDITGALTGGTVRYGMRKISFLLFPVHDSITGEKHPATEEHAALIRQKLAEYVHGNTVKLWLPDDPTHYFRGRMQIGEKGGYNKTTIPVTVTAEPWRYKNEETIVEVTASGQKSLNNETRRVIPVFTATDAVGSVSFGLITHQLLIGDNQFSDIVLEPGVNTLTFSNIGNNVVISYQEAVI